MYDSREYKPVFSHPYIMIKLSEHDIWSRPMEIKSVDPKNINQLNKLVSDLSKCHKNILDDDIVGFFDTKRNQHIKVSIAIPEKTLIKVCLPAGTVFAHIKVTR